MEQIRAHHESGKRASQEIDRRELLGISEAQEQAGFAAAVLEHYRQHKRDLPWRRDKDPYHIWVSEIMLQQTRVQAVIPYYERFLEELPSVNDLAEVSMDNLNKLWEGLGYYSRARNLRSGARYVMEHFGGEIPRTSQELLKIPGIGPYTAGAISSIAFGEVQPAIDGNLLRVMSRILSFDESIDTVKGKRQICEETRWRMTSGDPGDFNQGMMDIGATICSVRDPKCSFCPIESFCFAHALGREESYPIRKPKAGRRIEDKTVLLLRYGAEWRLEKRLEPLLNGLYGFPMLEGHLSKEMVRNAVEQMGYQISNMKKGPSGKHIFSHIEWHMQSFIMEVEASLVSEDISGYFSGEEQVVFASKERIERELSIPSAFQVFREVLDEEF